MNHSLENTDAIESVSEHRESTDTRSLQYLVPLGYPGIRSTRERRLRLRDNLSSGKPSRNADILAKDPHFWDFLQQINLSAYEEEIDARRARHFINQVCRIHRRHELDKNADASERFVSLIQQPFLNWLFVGETG